MTDREKDGRVCTTLDTVGHRPRRAASWSAMAVRSVEQREMGAAASAGGSS